MASSCVLRLFARASQRTLSTNCYLRAYSTEYKNRYYTKKHEWVSVTDNIGTIGISNYAQEALGEIVFAQLPEVGTELAAGDECAALESVKAAAEVYTPVAGTVIEKNLAVESSPSLVNESCYEAGWLFRVRLSAPADPALQRLMAQPAYDEYLKEAH